MSNNYLDGLIDPITNISAQEQLGYGDEILSSYLVGLVPKSNSSTQFEDGYKAAEDFYSNKEEEKVVTNIVEPKPLKGDDKFNAISHPVAKRLAPKLRTRESSNNYRAVNSLGYIGAYQQGAAMLIDLGVVKKGTTNKGLDNPDNWLRYSKQEYLNNPELQDKLFEEEIKLNTRYLKGAYKDTKDLYGMLAAAHLLGAGGAKARGKDGKTDANGTTFEEYYKLGLSSL